MTDHPEVRSKTRISLAPFVVIEILLFMLILAFATIASDYQARYAGRIYRGVTIRGIDVGGLTPQEATARVNAVRPLLLPAQVYLYYGDRTWTVSGRELGIGLDVSKAVSEAYRIGRMGSWVDAWRSRISALVYHVDVPLQPSLDEGACALLLGRIARDINIAVRNASVEISGTQVITTPAVMGCELDVPASIAAIRTAVANQGPLNVNLIVKEVHPSISEVGEAATLVQHILSAPIHVKLPPEVSAILHSDPTWMLEPSQLAEAILLSQVKSDASAVQLAVDLDGSPLRAFLTPIAAQINRPSRDALLKYDPLDGSLSYILEDQKGLTLDIEQSIQLIKQAAMGTERIVTLPISVQAPTVSMEDFTSRITLPLDLISEGVSYFTGSSAARAQNIRIAAARFHGVVVMPHTIFSFNEHLGEVSAEAGYAEAYVIFGDRTVLGPGGGICQVSTTCFRAAFWGGFPIVERHAHTYRVGWYEPPMGLDATVFVPDVDFRFENDTDTPILIQTEVDQVSGKLTFRFYGRKPNRTVEIEGPIVENVVPAGPPIYENDPSLPTGKTVQTDLAHDGADVTIYRIIRRDGEIIARERFFSRFVPWPARYKVGTGGSNP
ncbi:MAG: VanW family protein [Chloroflexi bacterium]|nr:VanW family protein [Chloroflexota bacterium]